MDNVDIKQHLHGQLSHSRKRKQGSDSDELVATPPKFPLLESVANRFEQNRRIQQEKLNEFKTRRDTERVHSRYIQEDVGYTTELLQAKSTASYWAKKNGVKDDPLTSKPRGYPVPDTSVRNRFTASSSPNNHSATSSRRQNTVSYQSASSTTSGNSTTARSSKASKQSATSSISLVKTSSRSANTSIDSSFARNQPTVMVNQSRLSGISVLDSSNTSGTMLPDGSPNRSGVTINVDSPSGLNFTASIGIGSTTSLGNETQDAIDLDLTADESLILMTNESEISPSIDRSNNAITRQQSKNQCKVLSCEAKFSSAGSLGHHMNLFKHSPCNPCLKATDCKLSPDPLCFICPDCDREFQTSDECADHMKAEKHLPFYPPLSVAGYMCAQCLYVFENFGACWQHIEQSSHRDICYPFADDLTSHTSGVGPIAVVRELVDDLVKKCHSVNFHVQCLECSMEISNPGALRQHMLETNNQHIVSALCDSNLVDVFAGYLAGYSCDKCMRLFNGDLKNGAKHDCAKSLIGTIMENNIQSFFDFVKRCALTLIKSIDSKDSLKQAQPIPGPSQQCSQVQQKPGGRKTRWDVPCGPVGNLRSSENEQDQVQQRPGPSQCSSQTQPKSGLSKCDRQVQQRPSPSQCNGQEQSKPCPRSGGRKTRWDVPCGPVGNLRSSENEQDQVELISSDEDDIEEIEETDSDDDDDNDDDCVILGIEERKATGASSPGKSGASKQTSPSASCSKKRKKGKKKKKKKSKAKEGINSSETVCAAANAKHSGQRSPPDIPGSSTINAIPTIVGSHRSSQIRQGSQTHLDMSVPLHPPVPPVIPASGVGPLLPPLVNPLADRPFGTRVPFSVPDSTTSQTQAASGSRLQMPRPGPSESRPRSRSPIDAQNSDASAVRERSRSPIENTLISTANLSRMKNIIFLDLDNWCSFFIKLPRVLPDLTFVWGFYGGLRDWHEPRRCYVYNKMRSNGQFYLNEKCGYTKDAADFAIVLTVGKMDERLPNDVAFTILSGDRGFMEVERQMNTATRKAVVINPHKAEQFSNEMIYTMVTSVTDT